MSRSIVTNMDKGPQSALQLFAITICITLNALDGFDVLAISFASPGIAADWGIARSALGLVLAMELVGMAIGSILLGGTADKYGRKPVILLCLVLMTAGMFAAAFVTDIYQLLMSRLITGLGIGGMLAATNAMVAEFANARYRNLSVILMATGYPLGAVVGGAISAELLEVYSWRSVFVFGGSITGTFLFIVCFLLPESVVYMSNHRDRYTLQQVNSLLRRMNKPVVSALSQSSQKSLKLGYRQLLSPALRRLTVLLIVAYFAHIMTFYFILKWIPKIVADMGFAASEAGRILVWANLGGAMGAILLGLLASKLDLRRLLMPVLLVSFVMICIFGLGYQSLAALALVSAATGFFTNSGVVGLYGLMARSFPANVRASGTGIVIGLGRGGAALSPIIAGVLFDLGVGLQGVAFFMGGGALIAATAVYLLKPEPSTEMHIHSSQNLPN